MLKSCIACVALLASGGVAQTIDLAGAADGASRISEFNLTGAFAQIDFGDGGTGDADGAYSLVDDSGPLGTALDVFPSETNFGVGSLSFDNASFTGAGVETLPVTAIDLAQLFTANSPTSDISGVNLSNFFFSTPVNFAFGAVDASDTVTFTDGVLTAIDLVIDASFTFDLALSGQPTSFEGSFSIAGNRFSLFIDDTEFDVPTVFGTFPQSRVLIDIAGTVDAVIPAPGVATVLAMPGLLIARRRRAIA